VNTAFRVIHAALLVTAAGFAALRCGPDGFVATLIGVVCASYVGLRTGEAFGDLAADDCKRLATPPNPELPSKP
jgi:hypothetical protein